MSLKTFLDRLTGELVERQVPTSLSGDPDKYLNQQGEFTPAGSGGGGGTKITVDTLDGSGKIVIPGSQPPVLLSTDKGTLFPVEKQSLEKTVTGFAIDPASYLVYDNSSAFTGTWTVYLT